MINYQEVVRKMAPELDQVVRPLFPPRVYSLQRQVGQSIPSNESNLILIALIKEAESWITL